MSGFEGIVNVGSTCYLSAILQALRQCITFVKAVNIDKDSNKELLTFLNHPDRLFNPRHLINSIKDKIPFEIFQENDPSEFLQFYLQAIIDQQTTLSSPDMLEPKHKVIVNANKHWKNAFAKFTFVTPIFFGQIVSQIKCGHCKSIYQTYEVIQSISVEVNRNLENAISKYFSDIYISDWKCDKCNQSSDITTSCKKIIRIPDVLIITINRFSLVNNQKNEDYVDIPKIIQSKVLQNNLYKLRAIILHLGSSNSGHYTCLIGNRMYDDETISKYNPDDVFVGRFAYMCIYEKIF